MIFIFQFKFQFSDFFDKILIIVGVLAGLASAGFFSTIFLLFGEIVEYFLNLLKYQNDHNFNSCDENRYQEIFFKNWYVKCFFYELKIFDSLFDPFLSSGDTFEYNSNKFVNNYYYFFLGFGCLTCNYLAYVCMASSAERQIKKIK